MKAYYNEIDPFTAEWLRELIAAGHIAPGDVDDRSIEDVRPSDLVGYTQCHFFAGTGVWSHALRRAGWPDDRPVWTGSCPCQPFSAAGKGVGVTDERHLWPAWFHLIAECRPDTIFGEQVEAAIRHGWLDLVQADLEREAYAVGAVVFPASGVGAPHIRSRLYWVANAGSAACQRHPGSIPGAKEKVSREGKLDGDQLDGHCNGGTNGRAGHTKGDGRQQRRPESGGPECFAATSGPVGLANARGEGLEERQGQPSRQELQAVERGGDAHRPRQTNGLWRDADWVFCRDGKWRPVEPAFKQMADGVALVMGYLRDCGADEKVKEAIDAAANHPYTAEVLREVREGASMEKIWLQVGGQVGFFAATVLLSFVLQREGELGHFVYCAEKGSAEECAGLLRGLRGNWEDARSPLGPEHPQQFRQQLENAMSSLPQISTLEVLGSMNGSPLAHGASARVGRLRAYGNAINAEVATGFIRAYLGT